MSKIGTKRMWRICLLGATLTMVLAIGSLLGVTNVQASQAPLDVGDYKGERAETEWLVPEETGKIFAGWYTDTNYDTVYTKTTGEAYPKFVDEKVLTVKKQLASGTENTSATTSIRFLTAIDSRMFKGVTFDVQVPESSKHWTKTETVAYSSMLVDGDETPKYANNIFGTEDAKYFVAHKFTGIPNAAFGHSFIVTPSWETMDGTIVTGEVLNFTINGEFLAGSLFADKVSVNGATVTSAVQKWDISQVKNNIVTGTHSAGGFCLEPIYFAQAGKSALLRTYITVPENVLGNTMAGIYVHDGINKGWIGIIGNGLIYSPWNQWIDERRDYAVITEFGDKDAQLDIVLKDGIFSIWVDGVFYTTYNLSNIMPNTASNADLAFGLTMCKGNAACTTTFSNINFTTDATIVNNFLLSNSLFATDVMVNEKTVTSAFDKWDYSKIASNTLTASYAMGSNRQPVYFKQTGTTALLQMQINASDDIGSYMAGGLYIHDGTTAGYLGVIHKTILYSPWWQWDPKNPLWDTEVLSPWGSRDIQLSIAYKDGTFYVYRDGVFGTTMTLSTLFNGKEPAGEDLAFGLFGQMESTCTMTFSNIQFTTDAATVDAFLMSKSLFAEEVTVNEVTISSVFDKWDSSQIANNTLTASYAMGSNRQPVYFKQTGTTALLQSQIKASDDIGSYMAGGLYIHDGTTAGYLGVIHKTILYSPWWQWDSKNPLWDTEVLSPWGSRDIQLSIAYKDGTFYVYRDGVFGTTMTLSTLFNGKEPAGEDLAFGLFGQMESTCTMTFSNIQFTTDASAVDAFLESKGAQ